MNPPPSGEGAPLQAARARQNGAEATERVELLRLRFPEGMDIREIARLWGADAVLWMELRAKLALRPKLG